MGYFFVAALAGALFATFNTWAFLRRFRQPYPGDGALLRWTESPTWFWQLDGMWTAFLILHNLFLLLLFGEFLAVCARVADSPSLLLPGPLNSPLLPAWMYDPILGALLFLAYFGLAMMAFSFAVAFSALVLPHYAPPMPYTIVAEGLAAGQHLLVWNKFSCWKGQPERSSLSLYSSVSPALATVRLEVENPDLHRQITGLLSEYLPSSPPAAPVPLPHRRWTLVGRLVAVALPLVLIGLALYLHGDYWAWYYYDVAGLIIIWMGYRAPKALGAI